MLSGQADDAIASLWWRWAGHLGRYRFDSLRSSPASCVRRLFPRREMRRASRERALACDPAARRACHVVAGGEMGDSMSAPSRRQVVCECCVVAWSMVAEAAERSSFATLRPNVATAQQGPSSPRPASLGRLGPAPCGCGTGRGHVVARSHARQRCMVRARSRLRCSGVAESHQDTSAPHAVDDAGAREQRN